MVRAYLAVLMLFLVMTSIAPITYCGLGGMDPRGMTGELAASSYTRLVGGKFSPSGNKIAVLLESYRNPDRFEVFVYTLNESKRTSRFFIDSNSYYYRGITWIDEEHVLALDMIIDVETGRTMRLDQIASGYPVEVIKTPCKTCVLSGVIEKIATNHKGSIAMLAYLRYDPDFERKCLSQCGSGNIILKYLKYNRGYLIVYNVKENTSWAEPIKPYIRLHDTGHPIEVNSIYIDFSFSPDGEHIAFLNETNIMVFDVNGNIKAIKRFQKYSFLSKPYLKTIWAGRRILVLDSEYITVFDEELNKLSKIQYHSYPFGSPWKGFYYTLPPDNRYVAILDIPESIISKTDVILTIIDLESSHIQAQLDIANYTLFRKYVPAKGISGQDIIRFSPDSDKLLIAGYPVLDASSYVKSSVICIGIDGRILWRTRPRSGILVRLEWLDGDSYIAEYIQTRPEGYSSTIVIYNRSKPTWIHTLLVSSYTLQETSQYAYDPRRTLPLPKALVFSREHGHLAMVSTWFPRSLDHNRVVIYNATMKNIVYEGDIPRGAYEAYEDDSGGIWIISQQLNSIIYPLSLYEVLFIDPSNRIEGYSWFTASAFDAEVYNSGIYTSIVIKWHKSSTILFFRRPKPDYVPLGLLRKVYSGRKVLLDGVRILSVNNSIKLYKVSDSHLIATTYRGYELAVFSIDALNGSILASLINAFDKILYAGNGVLYAVKVNGSSPPTVFILKYNDRLERLETIHVRTYNTTELITGPDGREMTAVYAVSVFSPDKFAPILSPHGLYMVAYGVIGKYYALPGLWHSEDLWGIFIVSLRDGKLYVMRNLTMGADFKPADFMEFLWSPNDDYIAVINRYSHRVTIYRIDGNDVVKTAILRFYGSNYLWFKWLDDESFLVINIYRDHAEVGKFNVEGRKIWLKDIVESELRPMPSPNEEYVLLYNTDGDMYIYDTIIMEYNYVKSSVPISNIRWLGNSRYFYTVSNSSRGLLLHFYNAHGDFIDEIMLSNDTEILDLRDGIIFIKRAKPDLFLQIEPTTPCILIFNGTSSMIGFINTINSPLIIASHQGNATRDIWLLLDVAAGILLVVVAGYYFYRRRRGFTVSR